MVLDAGGGLGDAPDFASVGRLRIIRGASRVGGRILGRDPRMTWGVGSDLFLRLGYTYGYMWIFTQVWNGTNAASHTFLFTEGRL